MDYFIDNYHLLSSWVFIDTIRYSNIIIKYFIDYIIPVNVEFKIFNDRNFKINA